jgi:hypothetical protein
MVLAGHRPETADLPEEPFHDGLAAAVVLRQEPARLLRQVDQDSAGLEDGERLTSVSRHGIDDCRHPVVRSESQKLGLELIAGADVVVEPGLFKKHCYLVTVWCRPIVKLDHDRTCCVNVELTT